MTKSPPVESKDALREGIETIVFVVVLVLLLKTFAAEAFVIPTGSMATTLYGYQKLVVCPQCDLEFPVNCASEVEADDRGRTHDVTDCTCPNCRYHINFRQEAEHNPKWRPPACNTGDRVLVAKFLYDSGLMKFKPFDVVVFKFPEGPQQKHQPMNYIKRGIGKSGQTIGIYYGDLYVAEGLTYENTTDEPDLPIRRQMHRNEKRHLLEEGSSLFQILRKPPDVIMAQRRIVYDNDHQARDLTATGFPPRWGPEKDGGPAEDVETAYEANRVRAEEEPGGWKAAGPHGFQHPAGAGTVIDWLRYRNLLRDDLKAQLIKDFMGYNSGNSEQSSLNWVGDLMLDCQVTVEKAEGELVVELSRGVDRFQANWDLGTGTCTLWRLGRAGKQELASKPTRLSKPGTYHLRFANVDQRLTLWLDRDLPFGDGVAYPAPREPANEGRPLQGPDLKNDLEPVSIGVRGGGVGVQHLQVWRDTYYTNPDGDATSALTLYVQPGHYLCLGDNSPQSSDSRSWAVRGGLVPERLMLGRALLVYWPYNRPGLIR
jgi:signal peptidase I